MTIQSLYPTPSRRTPVMDALREPLFAEILRRRLVSTILLAIGTAQIITAARHIAIITCPIPKLFGLPCPGCGLTRGTIYLAAGDWRQALTQHAFAPFVLIGLLMLAIAAFSPRPFKERFCNRVASIERRTAIIPLLLILLLVYWLARLLIAPQSALAELRI